LTDYRNFFTAIFSKELRNKNLLKFSPHLKSVVALPCTIITPVTIVTKVY